MDQPETPTPSEPPATHWNTLRDPAWSFACPYCGEPAKLLPLIVREDFDFGQKTGDVIASCRHCERAYVKSEWEYLKAMELLQR